MAIQAFLDTLASVVTAVYLDILVTVFLDILVGQEFLGIQEQAVILDSLEHQATLAFLVILEFQVFRVIQAHLDTQASADTQVHQVIPAQADTQVRLAFQVIQESVDILALVCLVTAVRLDIQAYLDTQVPVLAVILDWDIQV